MKNTNRQEALLENWRSELTDIIYSTSADLSILNRDLKIFIEELLEAKQERDFWLYRPPYGD